MAEAVTIEGEGSGFAVMTMTGNRWRQNCHALIDEANHRALVIDPGYDGPGILEALRARGVTVEAIIATHTHFDHIAGANEVQEKAGGLPFYMHAADEPILSSVNVYTMVLKQKPITAPNDRRHVEDGGRIDFGGDQVRAKHVPGHTPGGLVYAFGKYLFTGDLLLRGQDDALKLPGFNKEHLKQSIKSVFETFPGDMIVYPGHGRSIPLSELAPYFAAATGA